MEKLININDVSLNFNLRQPKGNKCTNVYCVLKVGNVQYKIAIGCKVNSWQWNKRQQMPIVSANMTADDMANNIKVANVINQIKFGYMNYLSYICSAISITENEVKENITNVITEIITNDMANNENLSRNGRPSKATNVLKKAFDVYYTEVNPRAKKSSKDVQRRIMIQYCNYCEEIGRDSVNMLSQKGINEYKSYLIKSRNSPQNVNTKVGVIAMLINNVIAVHNDFLRYKLGKVDYIKMQEVNQKGDDKKRRPLTKEELNKLENCDTLTEKEKEYRDLFILECNCSYRVSDTPKMFDKNQQQHFNKNGVELMVINTQKENIDAVIWVTPKVKELLERYEKGFKYAKLTSANFAKTYNYQLKKIAKKCGWDSQESYIDAHGNKITKPLYEIIGSHFGRYTFVRDGKEKGFTSDELKDFTGHADDKMIDEIYFSETKADKANNAFRAIERITNANQANANQANANQTNANQTDVTPDKTYNELIAAQAVENFKLKKESEKQAEENIQLKKESEYKQHRLDEEEKERIFKIKHPKLYEQMRNDFKEQLAKERKQKSDNN